MQIMTKKCIWGIWEGHISTYAKSVTLDEVIFSFNFYYAQMMLKPCLDLYSIKSILSFLNNRRRENNTYLLYYTQYLLYPCILMHFYHVIEYISSP